MKQLLNMHFGSFIVFQKKHIEAYETCSLQEILTSQRLDRKYINRFCRFLDPVLTKIVLVYQILGVASLFSPGTENSVSQSKTVSRGRGWDDGGGEDR